VPDGNDDMEMWEIIQPETGRKLCNQRLRSMYNIYLVIFTAYLMLSLKEIRIHTILMFIISKNIFKNYLSKEDEL
jgi:hypothetical protein